MFIFLIILLAGLTLIYINVSPVAEGAKGKLLALGILVALFLSMSFRGTFLGSMAITFFAVWLCQALLLYIPWNLFRVGRRLILRKSLPTRTIKLTSRILLVATVALTLGLIAYGYPHNKNYVVHHQKISQAKVKPPFTVMFFSDIHFAPLFDQGKLRQMIEDAQKIQPDFLLFGGDLADISTEELNRQGYDSLFRALTATAKIAALGVNGNHEAMQESNGSRPSFWMQENGMIALDDSTACFEISPEDSGGFPSKESPSKICFTGRTDFQVARSRGIPRKPLQDLLPKELQQDSANTLWFLLDHQPKGIEKDYQGPLPDFAFSGHTHNGQFFPGTLVIGIVWRLAYGLGNLDGVPWLVSAGVDSWGPPVRVGTETEVWVLQFFLNLAKKI